MPIQSRIDEERDTLVVEMTGELTPESVREALDVITEDPRRLATSRELWDLTRVQRHGFYYRDLTALARLGKSDYRERPVRVALVALRDHVYGSLRSLQALMDTAACQIAVFRSLEDARHWLDDTVERAPGNA